MKPLLLHSFTGYIGDQQNRLSSVRDIEDQLKTFGTKATMAPLPEENGGVPTASIEDQRQMNLSHSNKPKLVNEADRIRTFNSWPVNFISKESLAAAGFYYLHEEDLVRCAFCPLVLGDWKEGDIPMNDHKRFAPTCPFVRAVIAAKGSTNISSKNLKMSNDVCGVFSLEIRPHSCAQKDPKPGELNVEKYRSPMYPQYCSADKRLKTFSEWPKSLHPRPQNLVDAGFCYSGKSDETFCFHCGGGLKDWDPLDDPMKEHAKWYPQCLYVILNKTKDCVTKSSLENEQLVSSQDIENLKITSEKEEKVQSLGTASSVETKCSEISNPVNDGHLCKVCFQEELGVVTLPCRHLVTCSKCAPSLTTCPVCREPFTALVRVYL